MFAAALARGADRVYFYSKERKDCLHEIVCLTSQQVEESRRKYGANTLTEIPSDPLWKKILEGFKDPMLMILMVALAVQVALFFLGQAEWFEPVGISSPFWSPTA